MHETRRVDSEGAGCSSGLGLQSRGLLAGGAIFSASRHRRRAGTCSRSVSTAASTAPIQKAVDTVKKGNNSIDQDQARHLPRGRHPERPQVRRPDHHRHEAANPKTILDGKNAQHPRRPAGPERHRRRQRRRPRRSKNLWARNFPTNGLFVHADTAATTATASRWRTTGRRSTAPTACSPSTAPAARSPVGKGWGHGDSAIYIGETPPQDEAEVDRHRPRQGLRERARLLRHELEVRRHPRQRGSTTTAPASSRTRSTPSRSSRTRNGKIRNNDIFWNNFNYFLPKSPVKTVSGGLGRSAARRSTTRPGSAWSCSAPTAGASRTTTSSATSCGAPRASRTRSTRDKALNHEQPDSSTTRWVETAPTRTASTSSTTAPARATASRATRRPRSTSPRPPRTRSRSSIRAARHRTAPAPAATRATAARSRPGRRAASTSSATPPCTQAGLVGAALASGLQGAHADRHQELRQVQEARRHEVR